MDTKAEGQASRLIHTCFVVLVSSLSTLSFQCLHADPPRPSAVLIYELCLIPRMPPMQLPRYLLDTHSHLLLPFGSARSLK